MNRVLKTLLLWLLIAALPVQGLAAVVKASCGPDHHSQIVYAVQHDKFTAFEEHNHVTDPTHDHHALSGMDGDAMQVNASFNETDETSASKPQTKSTYCSACATCCVGAIALISTTVQAPALSHSEFITVRPSTLVVDYIPSNLERPPRYSFV
jgi:hypothetical protein